MLDPLWIIAAFIFGAAVSRIGLPPLVGYLIAGFVLNSLGVEGGDLLEKIAYAGVTLLLFTIGLKLKLKSLAKPEVWVGATTHMLITIVLFGAGIGLLCIAGFSEFRLLDWKPALLIAFALSFSSTVFAVKVLEEKSEMASRHANVAIGILIMQDVIAVVFLVVSAGKYPTIWALALVGALFLIRPLLFKVMSRCGHGELLMLFGILMAAVGYSSFELVGLKGGLGALVFGMLVAVHSNASELAETLIRFKDLFLVGFFLSIGISGSPTFTHVGIAFLLTLAMPLKVALFFGILTRLKLRARTSILASLSLANYSEFGLIVASSFVASGGISGDWLVILAITVSMTFILAAPANSFAHNIYARWSGTLRRFETADRLPGEEHISPGEAQIAVIGMGRVGTAAYDEMRQRWGDVVIGVDFNADTVETHRKQGRNVVYGAAADCDFWERLDLSESRINMVMMTLPDPKARQLAIRLMKERGYQGQITASVRYKDEIPMLKEAGVDAAYVLFEEAGVGFANHVCEHVNYCHPQDTGLSS